MIFYYICVNKYMYNFSNYYIPKQAKEHLKDDFSIKGLNFRDIAISRNHCEVVIKVIFTDSIKFI